MAKEANGQKGEREGSKKERGKHPKRQMGWEPNVQEDKQEIGKCPKSRKV